MAVHLLIDEILKLKAEIFDYLTRYNKKKTVCITIVVFKSDKTVNNVYKFIRWCA